MRVICILLANLYLSVNAFAGLTAAQHLQIEMRAQREGWVYDSHHPDYATGLLKIGRAHV